MDHEKDRMDPNGHFGVNTEIPDNFGRRANRFIAYRSPSMNPRSSSSKWIALVAFVLSSLPSMAVDIIVGPTLTMDLHGRTPLAGVVQLVTATPAQAGLSIAGNGDSWTVTFPGLNEVHFLPVYGLKSDRVYSVELLLDGVASGQMMAVTPPLPADFPTLSVNVSDPNAMEPGFTLLDCFGRGSSDPRPGYTIIVDDLGEVVWYSKVVCCGDCEQLQNGNLFNFHQSTGAAPGAWEHDLLGVQHSDVTLEDPGTQLHHDLERTPMGTFVSLTHFSVEIDDFPTSETDPNAPTALTLVRDEPVVEFLPDGTLRDWWLLTDMLDSTRIGYNSLRSSPEGVDWVHTNAVTYDPSDDSFIVSSRHQDAVFKFSRATGDLVWILGPPENWSTEFQPFLLAPDRDPVSFSIPPTRTHAHWGRDPSVV